jgi:hypothetical protein
MPTSPIRNCDSSSSLFKLVDEIWKGPFGNETFHRICTMTRHMGVKFAVVELIDKTFVEHAKISEEIAAIEMRLSGKVSTEIYKVTFLKSAVKNENDVLSVLDNDFLGYAIIINLTVNSGATKSYIFESIIRDLSSVEISSPQKGKPGPPSNHFLHVKKAFTCSVLKNHPYKILQGTFFCQQSSITSVCAHACALMMLNNCTEVSTLITFEDINHLLGIDHLNRMQTVHSRYGNNERATHEGLTSLELEKVFKHFGFVPYRQTFENIKQRYFREFIYGFIESGYPALLTFTTISPNNDLSAHVVAVVGHTLNAHSWLPSAFAHYAGTFDPEKPYLSTLGWINDLLVHDDNFGMQLCLPAHSFKPEDYPDPGIGFTPTEAIGIFPQTKNVRLLSHNAERIASGILYQIFSMFYEEGKLPKENYYLSHLQKHILDPYTRTVVLRTSLVERSDYLEHLRLPDHSGKCYSDATRDKILKALDKFERIWLVEVTEPDLYVGNLSKVIDIILNPEFDPNQSNVDFRKALIMLRFPEFLMLPTKFNPESIDYSVDGPLEIDEHLPLIQVGIG